MGYCYIKSKHSGFVIDIEENSTRPGASLDAFPQKAAGNDNQQWEFVADPAHPGYYFIQSKLNGFVITIAGNDVRNGALLVSSPQQGAGAAAVDSQLWRFVRDPAGSGYYLIQSLLYGNVIDIVGNSTASGAGLDAYTMKLSNSDNQLWEAVGGSFPPAVEMVAPPAKIGGGIQYIFWGGIANAKPYVPIENFVAEIYFRDALVVAPNSPPIGFQVNGFSPKGDKVDCWQQYGIQMTPGSSQLQSFAENWPIPVGGVPNLFNIHPGDFVALPNETTIPAGWNIQIALRYLPTGEVSGVNCQVSDGKGATLGTQEIDLVGQPLAAGGTISEADLAPIVALQLVLVGWANSAQAVLTSGAGSIIYTSKTPLTVSTVWPSDSDGNNGTAENANSVYGVMPASPSTYIVQSFGST